MNLTTKISLTIELEGSALIRKSKPEVIKHSVFKRNFEHRKQKDKDNSKMTKNNTFEYYSLVTKPATQHINISTEAYKYMISKECPSWIKPKIWMAMNEIQKLETHLQRICKHVGGKSFTYEILGD